MRRSVVTRGLLLPLAVGLLACGGSDQDPTPGVRTAPARPAATPVLDAAAFAAAFDRLERGMRVGERVLALEITPDRVRADVGGSSGTDGRSLTLPLRGAGGDDGPRTGGDDGRGLRLRDLDRDGPATLVAAALRGRGPSASATGPASVTLVPADRFEDRTSWRVAFHRGPRSRLIWTGDVHGEHVVSDADRAPAPAPGDPGPAVAPSRLNATSMLRTPTLRRALAAVRRTTRGQGVVTFVQVEADGVRVTVRRGERERDYEVDPALGVVPGPRSERFFRGGQPIEDIDPGVPQRALRILTRRTGRQVVKYLTDMKYLSDVDEGDEAPDTGWFVRAEIPGRGRVSWNVTTDGTPGAERGRIGG